MICVQLIPLNSLFNIHWREGKCNSCNGLIDSNAKSDHNCVYSGLALCHRDSVMFDSSWGGTWEQKRENKLVEKLFYLNIIFLIKITGVRKLFFTDWGFQITNSRYVIRLDVIFWFIGHNQKISNPQLRKISTKEDLIFPICDKYPTLICCCYMFNVCCFIQFWNENYRIREPSHLKQFLVLSLYTKQLYILIYLQLWWYSSGKYILITLSV